VKTSHEGPEKGGVERRSLQVTTIQITCVGAVQWTADEL
jgi:hypothetical protein